MNKYTYKNLAPIVATSSSWREVAIHFKITTSGGGTAHLKRLAMKWGIDFSHFANHPRKCVPVSESVSNRRKHFSEILVILPEGKLEKPYRLRIALIESGRIYRCEECDQEPIWNGKPLTIQIDHRNGQRNDNRAENLFFICPNCHTQTDNYGSKNSPNTGKNAKHCADCGEKIGLKAVRCRICNNKYRVKNPPPNALKIEWPHIADLVEMVTSTGYSATGRILGVSGGAVKNYLRRRTPFSLPSTMIVISCEWCGEKFERERSVVESKKRQGQIRTYCCISHGALAQHERNRQSMVSVA